MSEPGQNYSHMPKISPGGLPVSSIDSEHINIYTVEPPITAPPNSGQPLNNGQPSWHGLNLAYV